MRNLKTTLVFLLLGLTATVVAVSLLLMLLLPALIRRFACEPYGIRCAVGRATIHPHLNLTLDLVIHNLAVFELDGRAVALRTKRLAATLDLRKLIPARQITPIQIRIVSPELLLRKLDDGRWNALALAEVVRGRLRPTSRVSPIQLPRIALSGGEIRLGTRRVTNLGLELEPKPAPLLIAIRAQATIGGQTVAAHGAVNESFEGEFLAQAKEVLLRGATRPWTPRADVRFRLDPSARALTISEWTLEDEGGFVRGTAAIRFAGSPFAYELTVATWRADLAALGAKLPLHPLSILKGRVDGVPFTLKGLWPHLPVAGVGATVTGVRLQLPHPSFGATELGGTIHLEHTGGLLRLRTELRGESVDLLGQRHANPRLKAAVVADPRSGDLTVGELLASFHGTRIQVRGSARRWGREDIDLETTGLIVDHGVVNRLLQKADGRVAIQAITRPSIHARWPGRGRPWRVEIDARSIGLASRATSHSARLEEIHAAVQGGEASRNDLLGAIVIQRATLAGRPLSNLKARFEVGADRIRMPEIGVTAGGGIVQGHASFSRPSPLTELRVALSLKGVRAMQLFRPTATSTDTTGVALDGDLSMAVSDGQASATIDLPPPVTRRLARLLRGTNAASSPEAGGDSHLILRAQGALKHAKGLEATGSVTIHGLRTLLAGGNIVDRDRPVSIPVAYRDGRATLKIRELGVTAVELTPVLSRFAGGRILGNEGRVVLSADAAFGGSQAPSGGGEIAFRELSLDLSRKESSPAPLLRRLRGSLAFSLSNGLLAFKETTLRADGGIILTIKGKLPLAANAGSDDPLRLALPWTDASPLLAPWVGSAPGDPAHARITGQIRGDVRITGREIDGAVDLRDVHMASDLLHLERVSGTIPLAGAIGQASAPDRASALEKIAWKDVSEGTYDKALAKSRKGLEPDLHRRSLNIALLRYGGIELRDFEAALAPEGDHVAIQRIAFEAWGGRGSGWGAIRPLTGEAAIALLAEGLSLRSICDAFPPIKGYISGRLNGLADLSISRLGLERVQGKARFWAVDSRQERKEISRTLIEKLAGQRIRYFSLFGQDRRYDRGVLHVHLRRGDLIFDELDISHTTLGIKDLDIKVAPNFNKIGLNHLLETIREATKRIKAGATPAP